MDIQNKDKGKYCDKSANNISNEYKYFNIKELLSINNSNNKNKDINGNSNIKYIYYTFSEGFNKQENNVDLNTKKSYSSPNSSSLKQQIINKYLSTNNTNNNSNKYLEVEFKSFEESIEEYINTINTRNDNTNISIEKDSYLLIFLESNYNVSKALYLMHLLLKYKRLNIILINNKCISFLLDKIHRIILNDEYFTLKGIGLLPFNKKTTISTNGLFWNLTNQNTYFGFSFLSTSNQVNEDSLFKENEDENNNIDANNADTSNDCFYSNNIKQVIINERNYLNEMGKIFTNHYKKNEATKNSDIIKYKNHVIECSVLEGEAVFTAAINKGIFE